MSNRGTAPRCTISRAFRRWYQMSDSAIRMTARIVVTHAISRNHASSRLNGCFVDVEGFVTSAAGDPVIKRGLQGPPVLRPLDPPENFADRHPLAVHQQPGAIHLGREIHREVTAGDQRE